MGGEVEEERGGRASAASFWAWCNVNDDKKAYGAVVLTRLIYAGMFLVQKAAFDGGLNPAIFVFYRQAFATLCLAPLAVSLEWKDAPKLSLLTFCEIFVLALVGITLALNLNGFGLLYTSSTLAAASLNSLPVTTFLLALLLRYLKVNAILLPDRSRIVYTYLPICENVLTNTWSNQIVHESVTTIR
ncbi:unnamed protein product [Linum tenue]|uniref:WAT1-related protein n=1 Tax=Linum tenue TaxID=586396 RepID=A0AAV0RFJ5_9ROSI|nr:unnamed protein product [Linum tenue]